MATAKKKSPAKQPKTDPSDPIRYQLTPSGQKIVSNFRNQPPTPKPPVSSANWAAQIPKIKAAIKSAEAQVHYGQADNLRGHLRSTQRLLKKALAAEGKGGAGPSRGSGGNMGGRGNIGGGLRKQGK